MSRTRSLLGPTLAAVAFGAAALAVLVETVSHAASLKDVALDLLVGAGVLVAAVVSWRSWMSSGRALEALRRSEACQRSIVDAAGDAIIVIDDQAIIVTFNRAAERLFGYQAAEMIGTSLERLMTDPARQAHAAYLAKNGVTAMVEAARLRTVHKGLRKRGDVFPFELTMSEWSDGGRRMFTGLVRDVTERERTADALGESQARFAALFESSAEPLFIYELAGDGSFVLNTMNRAAEEFTGLSRFAVKGCTPDDIAAPGQARGLRRALLGCLDSAASLTEEVRLRSPGGPRSLRLTLSPMRDAAGEIRRVLASGRGVSPASDRADPASRQSAA